MTTTLRAGDLDRRITFYTPPEPDDRGQQSGEWAEFKSTSAIYKPQRYRHTEGAGSEVTSAVDCFVIRYRTDINEQMQLKFHEQMYEIDRIEEAKDYGRLEAMNVYCRRVVPQGRHRWHAT